MLQTLAITLPRFGLSQYRLQIADVAACVETSQEVQEPARLLECWVRYTTVHSVYVATVDQLNCQSFQRFCIK